MQDHEEPGAFTRATGRAVEQSSQQPRYRRYQFSLIAPHCGLSVLEIGSGQGDFAAQFTGLQRLVLTDVDPAAVRLLKVRFAGRPEVEVREFDLDAELQPHGPVDSVVAINVLEHLEDDAAALRALNALVRPGGSIILWVPAYPALYGDFDHKVGHYRRYTPDALSAVVKTAGLTVERCHPVNFLGGLAWWLAVRLGGTGSPRPRLVALYDRFVVPVTRAIERWRPPPFGQSVLCVARTARG
ncbi:MAG: methyltransferase domain-containing protein [Nitriliruptorales bacterium]|nr:methyltransferase domain-containing protein [Nitriliruptorales bacterium]